MKMWTERVIVIGLIVLIVLLFSLVFAYQIKDRISKVEYCIEKGWDGYAASGKCYKVIPHESGTGIKTIYSGYIYEVYKDG